MIWPIFEHDGLIAKKIGRDGGSGGGAGGDGCCGRELMMFSPSL